MISLRSAAAAAAVDDRTIGQGRDVHPQLLVSPRQTQELRLDNQLRTSILLLVIRYVHTLTQEDGLVRWLLQFKLSFLTVFDPQFALGQRLRMDKKERMIKTEQTTLGLPKRLGLNGENLLWYNELGERQRGGGREGGLGEKKGGMG
ncbi:hypothetical protein PAMA_011901 [Pampus argenteus]